MDFTIAFEMSGCLRASLMDFTISLEIPELIIKILQDNK
jgi:hypothetical protein